MSICTQKATVKNPLGIHARPAALVVKEASKYGAGIYLSTDMAQRINGKSIMGVMMLAAEHGAEVLVEAEGEDAAAAVAALAALLESDFEAKA
jgi:phosphocarrier protein HPr